MADDEEAILSRRKLLIAGALSGAAFGVGRSAFAQGPMPCLSRPQPPLRGQFSRARGRVMIPREQIPDAVRSQIPNPGICAAGVGASAWRIRLSLRGSLWAAEGDRHGDPWTFLATNWSIDVAPPTMSELVSLADRAWREPAPPTRATANGEVLAIADGDEHYFRQSDGPIRGGAAEALITRLRAIANEGRPR